MRVRRVEANIKGQIHVYRWTELLSVSLRRHFWGLLLFAQPHSQKGYDVQDVLKRNIKNPVEIDKALPKTNERHLLN